MIKGILHLWEDECVFNIGHLYSWNWSILDWEKEENVFFLLMYTTTNNVISL